MNCCVGIKKSGALDRPPVKRNSRSASMSPRGPAIIEPVFQNLFSKSGGRGGKDATA